MKKGKIYQKVANGEVYYAIGVNIYPNPIDLVDLMIITGPQKEMFTLALDPSNYSPTDGTLEIRGPKKKEGQMYGGRKSDGKLLYVVCTCSIGKTSTTFKGIVVKSDDPKHAVGNISDTWANDFFLNEITLE